jgi:ABC-type thiamin/hydroxymethylpyrimidine transport system permease subunit
MFGDPNYSYSYSLKLLIWISVSVFDFNMFVKWMYSNSIYSTFLHPIPYSYSKKIMKHPILSVFVKKYVS